MTKAETRRRAAGKAALARSRKRGGKAEICLATLGVRPHAGNRRAGKNSNAKDFCTDYAVTGWSAKFQHLLAKLQA